MAIRDIFKVSWKTFFNPAGWIDYDGLKRQNRTIFSAIKRLFTRDEPTTQETFEEAKTRLSLTDADVKQTGIRYRLYAWVFLLLALIIFAYAFFLLFGHHTISGLLLGLASSGFCLAQAFRYDFWSLQMRRQKLGLTFQDWKNSVLGKGGSI